MPHVWPSLLALINNIWRRPQKPQERRGRSLRGRRRRSRPERPRKVTTMTPPAMLLFFIDFSPAPTTEPVLVAPLLNDVASINSACIVWQFAANLDRYYYICIRAMNHARYLTKTRWILLFQQDNQRWQTLARYEGRLTSLLIFSP